MERKFYCGLTLILMVFIGLPLTAETGKEIMEGVMENQKPSSSAMDMRMNLIDNRGNVSTRRLQTLMLDDNGTMKSITLFLEPANIRNTRFLTIENTGRDNDQWIYLPALRKVKRIAAGERNGSFMGSDFSYSDMSGGNLEDSDYTLLREEEYQNRACWVVESMPKPSKESAYGKTVSWVDKETDLTLRVQFYDTDGQTQIKELTMEGPREQDGYWSAAKTIMHSLIEDHTTVLEMNQVKYDIPVNPGYFTTTFLQTGRP